MCLSEREKEILQALYDCNRIPLWVYDASGSLRHFFLSALPQELKQALSLHMKELIFKSSNPEFDILCYNNELYGVFSFQWKAQTCHLLAGPMLLSASMHIAEMRSLSFADRINPSGLKLLVENLPVVSLNSFGSSLRMMLLLLNRTPPTLDEIRNYRFSDLQGTLNQTVTHELFENMQDYRLHTPYGEELAVLNCVKEGDLVQLEEIYRTLPPVKYGNMSNNPLRLFFYGCIANTTLVTRYAIEGGLDEETAFTLSDVYIRQMEHCGTFYELNLLNEKMAADFTEQVAKAKAENRPKYIRPIAECVDYIERNLSAKISLSDMAQNVHLTPKYLSYLFQKETGQKLSSFVENERIKKAKKLLVDTQYSCKEISDCLAFYSQSYFISTFKKRTQMTPKDYRDRFSKLTQPAKKL